MFLPIRAEEVDGQVDIVYVIGEAYVDHPSFGHAIVSRWLEHLGVSVAIVAQPQCDADYMRFGEPKYGFFVTGGVVDSMVNNYTVAKQRRTRDVYSEGGDVGKRPDRCVDVYCRALKRLYPTSAVVIGGIEASLRRFAHYDYWADKVLPSILVSSGADLLIYGMGEKPIADIVERLQRGIPLAAIQDVRGTCYMRTFAGLSAAMRAKIERNEVRFCPTYEQVCADKVAYAKAFRIQSDCNDPFRGGMLMQKHGDRYLVQMPMQLPMTPEELDEVYALPYERTYHPIYTRGVPAIEEVQFSLTSVRGCFGSCNYCAITYHQGRIVQKRSADSIVAEGEQLTQMENFKGYIHDVGGPTANFRDPACQKQMSQGTCKDRMCIGWEKCPAMRVSHDEYLGILRRLRSLPRVKKVFVRSGIRFDYVMYDPSKTFLRELTEHHVSGQLKVAPEHVSDNVLRLMNKPPFGVYLDFKQQFDKINTQLGRKQYLVPYLISSHPGCTLKDAIDLACYLKSIGYMPEQVQDFYPTPSTKSTTMYYTGLHPDTMEQVYVARTPHEKQLQRALMQYRKKSNYDLVHEALVTAGRQDLIGFGPQCLIKPTKEEAIANSAQTQSRKNPAADKRRAAAQQQGRNSYEMHKPSEKVNDARRKGGKSVGHARATQPKRRG